jgi:hypothetical protein
VSVDEQVTRYLNELCWAMGGTFSEQQAVRDELRAHIEEHASASQLAGMRRDDAVRAALRDLGAADALGRTMRSSRRTTALRRHYTQPEGTVLLEHRSVVDWPRVLVLVAVGGFVLMFMTLVAVFLWP